MPSLDDETGDQCLDVLSRESVTVMSVSAVGSTNPWIEFTPQVMAAKQAATSQQIDLAVVAKSRQIQEAQASAVLQLLQQSASLAAGIGGQIDVRA